MKKLGTLIFSGFIGLALAACSGQEQTSAGEGDYRDTVVAALAAAPVSTDLHATNDVPSAQIHRHIFETLVFQDLDMSLNPGLATSWELIDDRVWEFNLREGVYFHNGEPFTAEDVAFTFERAAASPQVAPILGSIDVATIQVIDDHTVRIGTYEPFAPFLSNLAHAAAGIMNEAAVLEAGEEVGRRPVGTGPFTLVEWDATNEITLERFEDYHGQNPLRPFPSDIRRIVIRQIPEASVRAIELETGAIDIDLNPVPSNFSRLEADENFSVLYVPGLRTEYIGLNNQHPYLSDYRVRQAINYAVDVDSIIAAIYEGHGATGATVISENIFGHNPNIEPFPFDVERARELMAEAGMEAGFTTNIYANSERQDRVDVVTIIANQLAAININLNIVQMDWPSLLVHLDGNDAAMFALGWTAVTGDGDIGLFPLFHTSQQGAAGNRVLFSDARVDELLEIGRTNTDPQVRLDAYFEVQEILREQAPWIILIQEQPTVAINNAVQGFIVDPTGSYYLGNLTFVD